MAICSAIRCFFSSHSACCSAVSLGSCQPGSGLAAAVRAGKCLADHFRNHSRNHSRRFLASASAFLASASLVVNFMCSTIRLTAACPALASGAFSCASTIRRASL